MLRAKLANVKEHLALLEIDLSTSNGHTQLQSDLSYIMPIEDWHYDFIEDVLYISYPYGFKLPEELSEFGEVITDDYR